MCFLDHGLDNYCFLLLCHSAALSTQCASVCVFISAKDKLNIEELKQKLYEKAREIHTERFPYNDFLYQKYEDLEAEAQDPDKEDLEETT